MKAFNNIKQRFSIFTNFILAPRIPELRSPTRSLSPLPAPRSSNHISRSPLLPLEGELEGVIPAPRSSKIVPRTSNTEAFVEKLNRVIEEHIDDPTLNIDRLAAEMGLGRTVFYKSVKNYTGKTPNDFLLAYRLKKASLLLNEDEYNISQVAYMVGFSTPSHFSTSFKHFHGITPTQYKVSLAHKVAVCLLLCLTSLLSPLNSKTLVPRTSDYISRSSLPAPRSSYPTPIPVTYLLICCRTMNNGTKFLVNGQWQPNHDYRNIETTRYILQKIKAAGINTVGVDFTNPSMWDVPVYDANGNLVDDFSAEFKPMLDNIVQVCQEKDMNFFIFLGNTMAWTMKYWNTIAKRVWEDYAQLPNYQHYGFGDDRPLLVMFLPGESFWNQFNGTPDNEKDYIARFHIGTCQVNDPINPQTSDGWGYRNYSQSSDGNVRFACPNGGVPQAEWYRIDASMWKQRVDWAMKAKHYAVFGSYDDTCDGIFWGIADVSQSDSKYHINKKTVDDPYLYYNILRDKLRAAEGNSIVITQSNGNETTYAATDKDIKLNDALVNTYNPIESVRILQQIDNANVTYRRILEGKWESLVLPFHFTVSNEMLQNYIMAKPVSVAQTAYNRMQITFKYLTENEQVQAFAPIIIKGNTNHSTILHVDNTTIFPTTNTQHPTPNSQLTCNDYTITFLPNYELPILWLNNAYTLHNGTFTPATFEYQGQCYPYRLCLTVTDNNGQELYPGKTETYFKFNEPLFIETPTSINSPLLPLEGELEGVILPLEGELEGVILAPRTSHPTPTFDLYGRRVLHPATGLYITDNKKIIIN